MGYAVYEDIWHRGRWAGYGVPAPCDWPSCEAQIDRGLGYQCDKHVTHDAEDNKSIEEGCYLYFCDDHAYNVGAHDRIDPKGDSSEWETHMLVDESWERWRNENSGRVEQMRARQEQETTNA